jgi:undecaprenyl diphosphate synthase
MNADVDSRQASAKCPRHVAIIMDGNGRWASRRRLPRFAGHKAGVETVKGVVRACGEKGIEGLTLFAFSSENWRRPQEEVGLLMGLFVTALEQQVRKLHEHNIRLRIIGDRSAFSGTLRERIETAESLTRANTGLNLLIAANYGGRWDMTEAARTIARRVHAGELSPDLVTPALVQSLLALSDLPEPDFFIRTGGEKRVSNFLLWQLAYTELYFTDTLWPDFDRHAFEGALASFATRQRRFGRTGDQVATAQSV